MQMPLHVLAFDLFSSHWFVFECSLFIHLFFIQLVSFGQYCNSHVLLNHQFVICK